MDISSGWTALLGAAACIYGAASESARAQQTPYNYTTYQVSPASIGWLTCGATSQEFGCFGSGSIGPFGHVCALLESTPGTMGDTTKQQLYIMDSDYKNTGSVRLQVFRKVVVTGTNTITTTFTLIKSAPLQLVGGASVTCQAAANAAVIAAGTNSSNNAVEISKKTFGVTLLGGFPQSQTVTSIVADASGYISINVTDGYDILDPTGQLIAGGGGNALVIPLDNAYTPQ